MIRLVVSDPADPRLDDFRDLTVADRRPDRPGGRGAVIAEGVVVVRRLLGSPYRIRAVLGVAARGGGPGQPSSGGGAPRGDRLLILEGINDHENLGALFRNAAALGVDAVLLGHRCADPLYRRSVRVSMGHVLRLPFATLPRWPDDLRAVGAAGHSVLALTPRTGAVPLPEVDPTRHPRAALLVGAEGPGLSEGALAATDEQVQIPMAAGVDSLNVAIAAAIACYHLGSR